MTKNKISVAVVGGGGWGKNLIRTFASLPDADLKLICDVDESRLANYKEQYSNVSTTAEYNDVLKDNSIDAVIIATPSESHFTFVKQALEAGKSVFTEKPVSLNVENAEELLTVSEKTGKTLMVGHLLLYHTAVRRIKEYIENGELGDIYCMYSNRLNLGKIRKIENAWWSLAPHDISILNYLIGENPVSISANGQSFVQEGIEDLVFATLRYPSKAIAQIHVSWLDPHKMRKLTIVGSKKMVIFDDMESAEKIKIYDKGVVDDDPIISYNDFLNVRSGDVHIPGINMQEPLKVECTHFIDAVLNGTKPLSDGCNGLDVVRVLAAGQASMDNNGKTIKL